MNSFNFIKYINLFNEGLPAYVVDENDFSINECPIDNIVENKIYLVGYNKNYVFEINEIDVWVFSTYNEAEKKQIELFMN